MKGVGYTERKNKDKKKNEMYNGRGLFVSITIPEMVFFLFIPTFEEIFYWKKLNFYNVGKMSNTTNLLHVKFVLAMM